MDQDAKIQKKEEKKRLVDEFFFRSEREGKRWKKELTCKQTANKAKTGGLLAWYNSAILVFKPWVKPDNKSKLTIKKVLSGSETCDGFNWWFWKSIKACCTILTHLSNTTCA